MTRNLFLLTTAIAAVCSVAFAQQPPASAEGGDITLSGSVNLTNAGGTLATFPSRDAAKVASAVAAGDQAAVLKAGGTASDVAAALRNRCAQTGDRSGFCGSITRVAEGNEQFVTTLNGRLGITSGPTPTGNGGGLTTVVSTPEMQGHPTPPDTVDMAAGMSPAMLECARGGACPPGAGVIRLPAPGAGQ